MRQRGVKQNNSQSVAVLIFVEPPPSSLHTNHKLTSGRAKLGRCSLHQMLTDFNGYVQFLANSKKFVNGLKRYKTETFHFITERIIFFQLGVLLL